MEEVERVVAGAIQDAPDKAESEPRHAGRALAPGRRRQRIPALRGLGEQRSGQRLVSHQRRCSRKGRSQPQERCLETKASVLQRGRSVRPVEHFPAERLGETGELGQGQLAEPAIQEFGEISLRRHDDLRMGRVPGMPGAHRAIEGLEHGELLLGPLQLVGQAEEQDRVGGPPRKSQGDHARAGWR
ncbi:MAG: hypothetical protein D6738_03920 [Acidobacteria bacterium]|nr:MAG: hypothetical protein D6738_03920 [Acidobacteriota bacterium]